jgi:BTB/POZ domain/helix-turn-helix, Psq domain
MDNNLLRNTQHSELLTEIQKSVFEQGQFVDCTLLCNGSEFRVHKSILACASNFFHHIISEQPSNDHLTIVLSPEFDADTIFKMMEFIYIGQTHMSSHVVAAFQEVCEILQIKNLTPSSSDAMSRNDQPVIVVEIPNPGDHEPVVSMEDDSIIAETREDDDEHLVEMPVAESQQGDGLHYYEEHQPPDDENQQQHNVIIMEENQEMSLQYIELNAHTENLIQECIVQDEEDVEEEAVGEQELAPPPKIQRLSSPIVQTKPQPTVANPELLAKALKSMVHRKMKLNEAADHFGVPKPALYNRYKKFLLDNPNYRSSALAKVEAEQAIAKGVSVKNVFAKYNVPLDDIVKMKQRANEQQNTIPLQKERPTSSNVRVIKVSATKPVQPDLSSLQKLHLKANEYKVRLQRAINSCKIGMGLEEASALFSIPAPTLYRNIKHMKLAHIQQP